MKCYLCKKEISLAVRVYVKARNKREKSNFRNLCQNCYDFYTKQKINLSNVKSATNMDVPPMIKKRG